MPERRFPRILKGLAAAAATLTLITLALYLLFPRGWILSCGITFGTTAYHLLMRLFVGYLIPRLTNYEFDYRASWFRPRTWEPELYRKLKVRHWKGHLPTYAPSQFSLKEHSLHRVIRNMCGAEVVHEIIMVLSFLPLLTVPVLGALPVFLITSVLSALFDSIFVIAQRFNRPRIVRIYEKQKEICP